MWFETYAIRYEQNGDSDLKLVSYETEIFFKSVESCVADVDCEGMSAMDVDAVGELEDQPRSMKFIK